MIRINIGNVCIYTTWYSKIVNYTGFEVHPDVFFKSTTGQTECKYNNRFESNFQYKS